MLARDAKHWDHKVIQRWKRKIRNIRKEKESRKSSEESPNQHLYLHPSIHLLDFDRRCQALGPQGHSALEKKDQKYKTKKEGKV